MSFIKATQIKCYLLRDEDRLISSQQLPVYDTYQKMEEVDLQERRGVFPAHSWQQD